MTASHPKAFTLPLGIVDKTTSHFRLCREAEHERGGMVCLAWLGGTDEEPVAEIAPGLDPEMQQHVERELEIRITVATNDCSFVGWMVGNEFQPSWRGSLLWRVGSAANWYGSVYWQHVQPD
jgi:hypothetical protein